MLRAFLAVGRMAAGRMAWCLGEVSFLDQMLYLGKVGLDVGLVGVGLVGKVGLVDSIDSFCNIVTLSTEGADNG